MWKEQIIERKEMCKVSDIRPEHYKNCSLECWDAMKLMLGTDGFISFCLGNAFKYLWRHEYKNGKEDILKAGMYLGRARKYINDDSYLDTKDQLKQLTELYQEKLKEYEISTES